MILYERNTDHDIFIPWLWADMAQAGDLAKMFMDGQETSLSWFFDFLRPPTRLLLEIDRTGRPWFAAWFEPLYAVALFSVWVRGKMRRTKSERTAFEIATSYGFSNFTSLIGVTKQEHLLHLHEHLGYKILGKIPNLYGADTHGWIMTLQPDTVFVDQRSTHNERRRRREQEPIEQQDGGEGASLRAGAIQRDEPTERHRPPTDA